jgi:hypothetical protein
MPASSFHTRFIAFCDLNGRQRELELLGQSDPKILSRWHEALGSLASCYQQARERECVVKGLADPYFPLTRIFHELPAATMYLTVLPGVLGCSFDYAQDKLTLRRTVQVRLGSNSLRLLGITAISTVSRQQFMKYPG